MGPPGPPWAHVTQFFRKKHFSESNLFGFWDWTPYSSTKIKVLDPGTYPDGSVAKFWSRLVSSDLKLIPFGSDLSTNRLHKGPGTWYQVPGTRYQVPGSRYQVPGTRYPVPGTRYLVPGTRYQVPGTRYGVPVPRIFAKKTHQPGQLTLGARYQERAWYQVPGPKSLAQVPGARYLVPGTW